MSLQREGRFSVLDRRVVVAALGAVQILAWGTSFYFPAVFAEPIVRDTGWPLGWVVAGTSLGLLTAGLISPYVGRLIDRHGGRPILLSSSCLYAVGLLIVGFAPKLAVYLIGWAVIGLGMGAGLYDAVFAALGRIYGSDARGPITNLTLVGGFASTICWPLSAYMIGHIGWRDACFIYSALHLFMALPLQAAVLTSPKSDPEQKSEADSQRNVMPSIGRDPTLFALLAFVFSLTAGSGSIVIVHIMIFLQARGIDYGIAVGLAALFGPAQVGARVVEHLFGKRYHPIWTLIGSCSLMAIGLMLLSVHFSALMVAILLYGAGYGVSWVVRGTLPLALFGPVGFPRLMGKLAFPSLIVQALAPSVAAVLIEAKGPNTTIDLLTGLALINVLFVIVLWRLCEPKANEA